MTGELGAATRRNDYVALDLDRVVEAVNRLEPIQRFAEVLRKIESGAE